MRGAQGFRTFFASFVLCIACGVLSVAFGAFPTASQAATRAPDPGGGEPKDATCVRAMAFYDDGDYPDAFTLYTKSAKTNSACGLNGLGNYYFLGQGVPQNVPRAIDYWKRAAALNYPGAQFNLAIRYYKGQGVALDRERALALLRSAAAQGYAAADNELGSIYMGGKKPGDFDIAQRYLMEGYQRGDMRAAVNLGHLYYRHDVPDHLAKALHWYTVSSEYDQAKYQLGVMYWKGEGGVKSDPVAARGWFQGAAESGYADGEYFYGYMNYYGVGGPQDRGEGLRWFKAAADQGSADAMNELATDALTSDPPITAPRMQFAVVYFGQAAKLGNSNAQASLASILAQGVGFHDDPADPQRMHWVVPADPEQAYVWYAVAATKSDLSQRWHEQALAQMAMLRSSLSAAQIAQAQQEIAHQLQFEAANCGC
jgi:uncharacterized protein